MRRFDFDWFKRFHDNQDGNLAVVFSLCLIPIMLAVGMMTDFSTATNVRASMQNALDAATLSLASLPKTMTDPEREARLQEFYLGNGGTGIADLTSFSISATGEVDAAASAAYDMPTLFMQLANVTSVDVGVTSEMHKEPTLVEAKFEIERVSGWWNKTVTLKGKKYGEEAYQDLILISYAYNDYKYDPGTPRNSSDDVRDPKGYGTMQVKTVKKNAQGNPEYTLVQEQVCTTVKVSNNYSAQPGDIINTSSGYKFKTTCSLTPNLTGSGLADVSTMQDIYLEMDVPTAASHNKPRYLRSNDPATADRLYINGTVVVPNGKPVDIFSAVPCGETSQQAWEDGGSTIGGPVTGADFFYKVTGRCDYSQRPIGISLTK